MGRKKMPWSRCEYRMWYKMIERCHNPNNRSYRLYGARGISVCPRWRERVRNWYEDMWPRPSGAHSMDRIDNDGNYEPGNVRWATTKEQNRNKRTNRRIEFNGDALILAEWAEKLGLNEDTLKWRLKHGWDLERALTPYLQRVWTGGWKRYFGIG